MGNATEKRMLHAKTTNHKPQTINHKLKAYETIFKNMASV